ncbi:MAG TPA: TlpA disulfide reductase family protein [Kofleriaceae bacterium]|nr:TlpA disulfide reductase family protein [Kofleriaceae bacterium]
MNNSTKALVGLLLAGLAGTTIVLFIWLSGGTASAKTCQVGQRDCLPDVSFVDTHGTAFTPQSLAGKVVVVNFWATWCGPCLKEIPDLSRVYQKYKDQGVILLGVMVDDPDNQALLNFQSDHMMEYPVIRLNSDIQMSYGARYPTNLPTTFIYDRRGQQVGSEHLGAMSGLQLAKILDPLVAQR